MSGFIGSIFVWKLECIHVASLFFVSVDFSPFDKNFMKMQEIPRMNAISTRREM